MNYTYFNKKESEVIKNYKTNEDKIVIRLLSGDYYEIPLSKENEKKIIEEVLHQASERNNLKLCERYECFCKQAGPKKI